MTLYKVFFEKYEYVITKWIVAETIEEAIKIAKENVSEQYEIYAIECMGGHVLVQDKDSV